MDHEMTLDHLFEGEPDDFELESNSDLDTSVRNLEDEINDAELESPSQHDATGEAVPAKLKCHANTQDRSENPVIDWSQLTPSLHETQEHHPWCGSDNLSRLENGNTVTGQFTEISQNLEYNNARRLPNPNNWTLSQDRLEELLDRANTPSELELEQMDFQLHKVMEQIDSVNLRHLLHNIDPTLSKRKLFRIYRHAMDKLKDSDEEDEHQEEDAKRFGGFDDPESLRFVESGLSKKTSRNPSKVDFVKMSSGNSRDSSKILSNQSANRSSSSLLHSKPHLYDIVPTEVKGHFPTTIMRSPQKSKSRTSSLSSETRFETKTTSAESAPVNLPLSYEREVPNQGISQTPARSRLPHASGLHSTNGATPISGRSNPFRISAVSPTTSIHAVAGSPAPDPNSLTKSDFSPAYDASEDEPMHDLTPYASGTSQPPSTGHRPSPLSLEKRPSDPFLAGADEISFSPSTSSPPLSPLQGLAGQIRQPKRQTRRKPDEKDKSKAKQPVKRAVSARSVSKARHVSRIHFCARGAGASIRGVQGDNVKINKNRASSRKPSSKHTKPPKVQHDDVPRVPSLPQDMDVDLPLPELRLSFPAVEAAPQEAEGGKQVNESNHSPSNRKTRTTPKNKKAIPKQAAGVHRFSPNGHEQERALRMGLDAGADTSLSGASPSPSPQKPSTRGIAVRKTRASVRGELNDQDLEKSKVVVDVVSATPPKARPTNARRYLDTEPDEKVEQPDTPGSVGTDGTSDISPKTPARTRKPTKKATAAKDDVAVDANRGRKTPSSARKTKAVATKEENVVDASPKTPARKPKPKPAVKNDDDAKNEDVDQNKLTPTSAGKKGKTQRVDSVPTRRSPRIAKMKEKA